VTFQQDEKLAVTATVSNMKSYEEAVEVFSWADIENHFSWAKTGKVNMAYEAIDRHVENGRGDKIALHYSDSLRDESYSFAEMFRQSNRFANVLRGLGIDKGERVFIFMPRTPELYFSLFGALKVGAVVGPLFEAFMETAVRDRLQDSGAVAIVTTPALLSRIPRADLPNLKHVILFGDAVETGDGIVDYRSAMADVSDETEITFLDREDGLILHYTSGSTGKPKGVFHVQNAMIQHYHTGRVVLDLREDDIYWCTADPGWVTGTSYGIFAPWLNGVTRLVCDDSKI
jgi:acetyl-CoA synthetase